LTHPRELTSLGAAQWQQLISSRDIPISSAISGSTQAEKGSNYAAKILGTCKPHFPAKRFIGATLGKTGRYRIRRQRSSPRSARCGPPDDFGAEDADAGGGGEERNRGANGLDIGVDLVISPHRCHISVRIAVYSWDQSGDLWVFRRGGVFGKSLIFAFRSISFP
jgi:hypothetical protein